VTRYAARTLPTHRGPAAWNAILPDQPPATRLEQDVTADVVIVGAGFAGLSAARRLRQLDDQARIVVLEAGRIAEGAAGRNSGFMIDLPHDLASEDYAGAGDDRQIIALNRQAIAFARQAVAEYQIDINYFDPVGKVNGAVSEAAIRHNQSYARHLASLGEGSELLDQQQMREMTGSDHYAAGLYTPGTVMLQPAGYIRGLASGLRRAGVDLFEQTPVTGLTRQGGAWQVQTASGTTVSAGKVILTVNGHLESFGIAHGQLMQLFLYAVMTPELSVDQLADLGGHPRWGITPSDPMGTTVRRVDSGQGGNRIITRTYATLRPGMKPTARDMARSAAVMQHKFAQRFPRLAGLRMAHHWAGHLCLTMNAVSHAHQVDDGLFSGCVQNGLGTARGTLTGITAAELAHGTRTEISRYFDGEPPAKRLPPQPIRQLGANAVLRWKEWRARDE